MPSHTLPPDVFEAVVNALAEALVNDYRSQHPSKTVPVSFSGPSSQPR
jgi:hypothetical protein